MKNTLTIPEAAKLLGTGQLTIRHGIRTGVIPIGSYVPSESGKRGKYIIPRHLVEQYIGAQNMTQE